MDVKILIITCLLLTVDGVMNLLSLQTLKIYYNKYTRMVCLSLGNQWIGLSVINFKIFLLLIENPSEFERIVFRAHKCDVEILKVSEAVVILQMSSLCESTIVIDSNLREVILRNSERIKNMLMVLNI